MARWSVPAAAVLGTVAVCAFAYPGFMSNDSLAQLVEARTGVFHLHHPPLMAWIWRFADRLVPGPFLMLLLQNALLFGGFALVTSAVLPRTRIGPLLVLGLGCAPPVLALATTVWKDVLIGALLVAATGLLLYAERRGSRWPLPTAASALAVAVGVRHGGFVTVLPLTIWLGWLLVRSTTWRARLVGTGIGMAITLAASLAHAAFVRSLVPDPEFPAAALMVYDLAGIAVRSGDDVVTVALAEQGKPRSLEWVHARYTPKGVDPLYFADGAFAPPVWVRDPAHFDRLAERWRTAILRHPSAYLGHRLSILRVLMGLDSAHQPWVLHVGIVPNEEGISWTPPRILRRAAHALHFLRTTSLFKVWVYLLGLIACAAVASRRRCIGVLFLLASAAFSFLPLAVIAPSTDFRYAWWLVLAVVVSIVVLFADTRENREPAPG